MIRKVAVHVRPDHHAMCQPDNYPANPITFAIMEAVPAVAAVDFDPVDMGIVASDGEGRTFFWEQRTPDAVARFAYEPHREAMQFAIDVPVALLGGSTRGSLPQDVQRNILA